VDLEVPQGHLVAVVGATGSGKSSLLNASLGLMEHISGPEVQMRGKVTSLQATVCYLLCLLASVIEGVLVG